MLVTKLELRIIQSDTPAYLLAAKAGFAPARLSEYRNGKKSIPPNHLIALAHVFKCNPDDLIGYADDTYLAVRD